MREGGFTESEIQSRGVIYDVPLVLDDSEARGPSGHWMNTSGSRVYSTDRVVLAESLLKARKGAYFVHPEAEMINSNPRPSTPAIFIFDYRIFLSEIDPGLENRIWRERLCHPRAGRFPGSPEREIDLIKQALILLTRYANPELPVDSFKDVELHFSEIAIDSHKALEAEWPHVLVRRPALRYHISKARSRRAVARVLSILALLHSGRLHHQLIGRKAMTIAELLRSSPVIRVDHEVIQMDNESLY